VEQGMLRLQDERGERYLLSTQVGGDAAHFSC
jgi:hypothetical protein